MCATRTFFKSAMPGLSKPASRPTAESARKPAAAASKAFEGALRGLAGAADGANARVNASKREKTQFGVNAVATWRAARSSPSRPLASRRRISPVKTESVYDLGFWVSCCFQRRLGHLGLVTASDASETSSTEKILLSAIIISLLLHLLVFCVWWTGQTEGGWHNSVALPRWMQAVSKALMPSPPKRLAARATDLSMQPQLMFVEVDPALATAAPPKQPKFEGAKNTQAANREIKIASAKPNIDGAKKEYVKTIENSPPKPKVQPAPPPTPAQPQIQPQAPPRQSPPRQSYTPGNLAMAQPSQKAHDSKSDADAADQTQPQPQPQPEPQPQPRRHFSTLAEARAATGSYGQKSRQVGGVSNVSIDALAVAGTPRGEYINRMVEAIRNNWYDELRNVTADMTGKVVVRFVLHADGRVTDAKIDQNEVSELLATTCVQAITASSPYEKWPREMRLELPNDDWEIRFTFYYEP
jgi:hypothetical protein